MTFARIRTVRLITTLWTRDRNEGFSQVPVIAVFTKYDQFKRNIMIKLEDQGCDPALLNNEMKRIFDEYYLANLRRSLPFVCLEGGGIVNQSACTTLISVVQECTGRANSVWTLSKQQQMHSIVAWLHSYSCQYKRII